MAVFNISTPWVDPKGSSFSYSPKVHAEMATATAAAASEAGAEGAAEGAHDAEELLDGDPIRRLEAGVVALGVLGELRRDFGEVARLCVWGCVGCELMWGRVRCARGWRADRQRDRVHVVQSVEQVVCLVNHDDVVLERHAEGVARPRVQQRLVRGGIWKRG